MRDLLGPAHIGHVKEAVNALFDLDESPIIGEVAYGPLDLRIRRVLFGHMRPGVFLRLLDAERNLLLVLVDVEDDDLNLVTDRKHLTSSQT